MSMGEVCIETRQTILHTYKELNKQKVYGCRNFTPIPPTMHDYTNHADTGLAVVGIYRFGSFVDLNVFEHFHRQIQNNLHLFVYPFTKRTHKYSLFFILDMAKLCVCMYVCRYIVNCCYCPQNN